MSSEVLARAWEDLAPVMNDFEENYPSRVLKIHSLYFRGFNPNSDNSPEKVGEIRLWINTQDSTPFSSPLLLEKHKALLVEVWEELLKTLGDTLDRVMMAPIDGIFYIPGLYPSSININDNMVFYQLK